MPGTAKLTVFIRVPTPTKFLANIKSYMLLVNLVLPPFSLTTLALPLVEVKTGKNRELQRATEKNGNVILWGRGICHVIDLNVSFGYLQNQQLCLPTSMYSTYSKYKYSIYFFLFTVYIYIYILKYAIQSQQKFQTSILNF